MAGPPRSLTALGVCVWLALLAGCAGSPAQPSTPPQPPAPAQPPAPVNPSDPGQPPDLAQPPTPTGARPGAAELNVQLCGGYAAASRGARTPLDAMRTEAVLLPFIDLIELATQQVAQRAALAPDPAVAAAMREVTAAIEELDAQGHAKLPPGASPAEATVWLDPARLSAALDAADRACAAHPAPAR